MTKLCFCIYLLITYELIYIYLDIQKLDCEVYWVLHLLLLFFVLFLFSFETAIECLRQLSKLVKDK